MEGLENSGTHFGLLSTEVEEEINSRLNEELVPGVNGPNEPNRDLVGH